MEKINIAELLRDCPKGMELYSPIFGKVYLDKIRPHLAIVVTINKEHGNIKEEFLYDGRYGINGECMLFPSKGKTTWEGFQRPWNIRDAKDGDVIFYDSGWTCIFKCIHGIWYSSYCFITCDGEFNTGYEKHAVDATINGNAHLATKEQCNRLFQKMKESGYQWNPETKTLEKLIEPKFKVGDKVKCLYSNNQYDIKEITDTHYILVEVEYKSKYTEPIIEDKNWELAPSKFDTSSLKPFDRVLVRSDNKHRWSIQFFERLNNVLKDSFVCMGGYRYHQCIPFEGNEHLLDTANECKEYFRTWEKS